jgi:hypothetical protein
MFDGVRTLAIAPGNCFGDDLVRGTGYAAHLVFKEDGNVPERHELETTRSLGGVVSETAATTWGTEAWTVLARMNLGDDLLTGGTGFLPNVAEDEGLVIGNGIEYSFKSISDLTLNEVVINNILTR